MLLRCHTCSQCFSLSEAQQRVCRGRRLPLPTSCPSCSFRRSFLGWWYNPRFRFSLFGVIASLWLTTLFCPLLHFLFLSWLAAVNGATLSLFLYDKAVAWLGLPWLRVPEYTFALLMLLLGSPAVLFGVVVFQHKNSKDSFLRILRATLLIQSSAVVFVLALYSMGMGTFPGSAAIFAKCKR